MGDKRQRPCAKGASSRHAKGQEFYNDRECDPAIDMGARLTRIVGRAQSVVIFQPSSRKPGRRSGHLLCHKRRGVSYRRSLSGRALPTIAATDAICVSRLDNCPYNTLLQTVISGKQDDRVAELAQV